MTRARPDHESSQPCMSFRACCRARARQRARRAEAAAAEVQFLRSGYSNFVGRSTGRSAGLAPLRILSTNDAARRKLSTTFTPQDISPPRSMRER
jgi:hypothetical protein